jgi:sugar lactone lactonase YvrE
VEGATFLNDLTAAPDGVLYFTDTTRAADGVDIYTFADGVVRRWKTGTDLHRTNGLFAHGGVIAAGSTGDGYLKTVDLEHGRRSRVVASLAPRVIDGIRRTESAARGSSRIGRGRSTP